MNNAGHIGGVQIKLKMGKGEEESVEEDNSENSPSDKETEDKKEELEENKKDVGDLRKVIKLNPSEDDTEKKEEKPKTETIEDDSELPTKDSLEQKRAILQSIKDFDFQIKKNSEEIIAVNKKLDSITKDLDDLVSLYEIVSEQMNPFVGLSKVTKKRIEALENFTKEIEDLKNRLNDIEAFTERASMNLDSIQEIRNAKNQESGKNEIGEINKPKYEIPKNELSGIDINMIIEKTLMEMDIDNQIDVLIEEYIENLFK